MIIDLLPEWGLFLLTVVIVFLSVEIGFRAGRNIRGKSDEDREKAASSIAGVILGLLAFMLAFTFSMVAGRYETKKSLVRDEANVIRTAWHRADFLPGQDKERSKELLRKYVDERIAMAQRHDAEAAVRELASAVQIQEQLWNIGVAFGQADMNSPISAMYVESLNRIAELHASRVSIGLQARIPTAIWVTLISLLTLGMIGVGFNTAIADSRRSNVTVILAIAFSLVIALIAVLDHPGGDLMPVSQQPLINVQSEMKAASGS